MTDRISKMERALEIALQAHRGDSRRGRITLPYIVHPLEVVGQLSAAGIVDQDILSAALLHDVIEDHGEAWAHPILDACGPLTLELVRALSKPQGKSKQERKDFMFEQICKDWRVCLIKMSDRLSNISNIHTMDKWPLDQKLAYLEEAHEILDVAIHIDLGDLDEPSIRAFYSLEDRLDQELENQEDLIA
jgi:(p)ppGpp synthase/HD superfamily hydrolase